MMKTVKKYLLLICVCLSCQISHLYAQDNRDKINEPLDSAISAYKNKEFELANVLFSRASKLINDEIDHLRLKDNSTLEISELKNLDAFCLEKIKELNNILSNQENFSDGKSDKYKNLDLADFEFDELNNQLCSDWIDLPHYNSMEEKISYVRNYVKDKYNSLNFSGNFKTVESIDQLWLINNRWQLSTKISYMNWRDSLSILQQTYTTYQDKLNIHIDNKARLELLLKEKVKEIENTNSLLSNEKNNKIRIEDRIKDLKKSLDAHLSIIPLNIIIVGRIKDCCSKDKYELLKILDNKLLDRAEEVIKGWKIVNVSSIDNKAEIDEFFVAYKEAHSQIEDNYYGELQKTFRDKNKIEQLYYYKISRIEVYKYAQSKISKEDLGVNLSTADTSDNFDFNVFECKMQNNNLILSDGQNFDNLNLGIQVKKYIVGQLEFIDNINIKYKNEINDALKNYDIKISKLKNELLNTENKIRGFENLITKLTKEKEDINAKILQENKIISNADSNDNIMQKYLNARDKYEDFYKTRYTFINKPEIRKADNNPDGLKREEIFETMVEPIFNKFKELNSRESKTIVFQGKKDEFSIYYKFKHLYIEYSPKIVGFRILTLSSFTINDPIENNSIKYYFLNVAFKVKWDYELLPSLIIKEDNQIVFDESTNLSWRRAWIDNNHSIENQFGATSENDNISLIKTKYSNWRIPNKEELKSLGQIFLKSSISDVNKLNMIGISNNPKLPVWGDETKLNDYSEDKRLIMKIDGKTIKFDYKPTTEGAYYILVK